MAEHVLGLVLGAGIGLFILHAFILTNDEQELELVDLPFTEGVDTSYSGKYKDHPKVKALLERAPTLRLETLQRVTERTGLQVPDPEKIVLSFRDASPDFGYKAVSRRVDSPDGLLQLTEIGLERFVAGTLDIERVATHEFTHSVMRQAMAERYRDMPRWFREGAAVWTADQLDAKVRLEVVRMIFRGRDPRAALDGLIEKRNLGANYLDEGFVFAFVEEQQGAAGVRRVLRQVVVNGVDFDDALESVTGVSYSDCTESSREFGVEYIERLLNGSGWERLAAAITKEKEKDKPGAIKVIRLLLKENPGSFLVPVAKFLLAKLIYDANSPEASLEAIDAVIAKGTEFPWFATRVTYARASRLLQAGHYGRAAQAFEEFSRDYSWNGPLRVADAKSNLAEALIGLGEPERAIENIISSLEFLYPAQAKRARLTLFDALTMLGQGEEDKDRLGPGAVVKTRIYEMATYAQMGTYTEYPRLAAKCQVDLDCVVVRLPECIDACNPGPCGTIGWETSASVNKDVRSRYLAMLEDQELAKCAAVDCGACEANGQPVVTSPEGQSHTVTHQATCVDGACYLDALD